MSHPALVVGQSVLSQGALGPVIAVIALIALGSRVAVSVASPEGAHRDLERRLRFATVPMLALLAVVIVVRFITLSF